jgi:Carboxypeptidase regulatory-like domain
MDRLAVLLRRRALLATDRRALAAPRAGWPTLRADRPALRGGGRVLLATLSALALFAALGLALLATAPVASAADATGTISGTVTKAVGSEAIEGIEVCAYGASGEPSELEGEFPEYCSKTNKNGEYTISALPSNEYDVEFFVPFDSSLNYITQYYEDKSLFSEAKAVPVGPGASVTNIDAKMQVGGEIKGTVMAACACEDFNPLKNIEVTAYEASGKEFFVGYAKTNEKGEYTIAGLVSGSYKVEFFKSGLNYVTQYYKGKSSLATAESIEVKQEQAATGIDAELEVGGVISGTVTDASTHAALPKANVLALGTGEIVEGRAVSNESGQYTIIGLASGSYKLEFLGPAGGSSYIAQYYNNQPSFASANPVTANQGSTTPGVNAALVRKAPVNTLGPVALGTAAVGKMLSCSSGSWTGSPTLSYTYAWLRNGKAITGAIASTYVVQTADRGTGLACRVTATNKYGSAAAVSNTLTVPAAPPPPPPVPVITLSSTKIVVSGDAARVPLACANANCTGTIELTEQIVVRHRKGHRTISRKRTLLLGKGSYALSAGQRATILIHLTHTGKHALNQARHHRLSATARVSVTGGATKDVSILLSEKPRKHRRR